MSVLISVKLIYWVHVVFWDSFLTLLEKQKLAFSLGTFHLHLRLRLSSRRLLFLWIFSMDLYAQAFLVRQVCISRWIHQLRGNLRQLWSISCLFLPWPWFASSQIHKHPQTLAWTWSWASSDQDSCWYTQPTFYQQHLLWSECIQRFLLWDR